MYNPIKAKADMNTTDNQYIAVAYKLYAIENGEKDFCEEATAQQPFQFIAGLGMVLDAFEAQITDLKAGDKFDFTIPAGEAYGEYNDQHVVSLSKDIFTIDGKFDDEHVKVGAILPLMTGDGQHVSGSVAEIKADSVVVDLNHPYAGCDLNFVGEIVEKRPATAEELAKAAKMMSGEGCGCGCDHCGGDCDDHQGCGGCCH